MMPARPINPVTKGDREGAGMEPDVKANAAYALATDEKLANKGKPEQLQKRTNPLWPAPAPCWGFFVNAC